MDDFLSRQCAVLILLLHTMEITEECKEGFFGSKCQYKCHCEDVKQCTESGTCGAGKCARGFFSTSCQKSDSFTVFAKNVSTALKDNDDSSCISPTTEYKASYNVTVTFSWMRLVFHKDTEAVSKTGTGVQLEINENNCPHQTHQAVGRQMDIWCGPYSIPMMEKFVLRFPVHVQLCSLFTSLEKTQHSGLIHIRSLADQLQNNPGLAQKLLESNDPGDKEIVAKIAEKIKMGSTCKQTADCGLPGMVCKDQTCLCNSTTHYHVLLSCQPKKERHSSCNSSTECAKHAVCINEKCDCDPDTQFWNRKVFDCTNICPKGVYGPDCKKECSENCEDHNCNIFDGTCNCSAGWYGEKCDLKCNRACAEKVCDIETGKCRYGCEYGSFGVWCDEPCPSNCHYKSCNVHNGTCVEGCVSGTFGEKCDKKCDEDCMDGTCDQSNGYCEKETVIWIFAVIGSVILCLLFLMCLIPRKRSIQNVDLDNLESDVHSDGGH